ncbi:MULTISPECIES: 4-coumarate--CoA ligase family protein [unclassified Rhodococcus (in: high G+C Gram-positive bacteria)]|uniref:4-coumarate--CoA ligase family protein n=1 Tax=unclassified Rhodococcus (in: high G+C Gram-positive bacteria) TaxID=192944 RepID=UPI001469A733|nr:MULTISPECIES: 4-coumarate--CoA ligase family protein [unclassified Rhodococcus (in: high G+C Gram-positive bacteria)]MBF0660624.1 4-coumarate--CoA ligase family protein [Rhodococcus sp. (in: high G+C Gram-positive bacteria)]NMD94130.1 4-coumarate--CoA ligase family protein [Rhodococcus sp. BL-253-APC-6A1W]NME77624.1 4-coumarate--CoA ligase family protein [Rhodococcus sp. 105337]
MSFRSPFPDVEIPDLSVYDFLFGSIDEADLDRPALIDGPSGDVTDYRTLIGQVDGIAGALAARGIAVGDVVGLLSPNVPAFASVFHGILRAGATATTINALYTAADIVKQLEDSEAKALVTVSPLLPQAAEAAKAVGIPDDMLIVLDGAEGHPSLRDLLAERAAAPDVSFDPATHLAVLPYSSGTTGRPKGVMLTHRNLVANVCQINPRMGIGPQDRVLAVLPFFHIYGMTVLLNAALSNRAALVTMPKFDLVEFLGLIADRKCTYVFIAPPVAVALAKHPLVDQYDLSSIHTVFSGAAPLDKALGGAVAARLGCNVRQGYGMSEMSPVSHAIPFSDNETELDSVGPAVANMECKIVDPVTGEEVEYPTGEGVSEPGELWCKGPNIMAGYLKNDEATAETLDADGYLHTGDIATVDAQGAVRIVDRLKELIKYKGYQVPPAELEALLLTHPQIADAAVIGVTDDEGEEIPKAFVVRQPDSSLTEQDVIEFVAERVSPHKKVRQVQFIDVVPKSAAGKILRKDLRVPSA